MFGSTGLRCGTWALQSSLQYMGSLVAVCGDLVPRPGIEHGTRALGARSLSHWVTWEVPRQSQAQLLLDAVPFLVLFLTPGIPRGDFAEDS